MSKKKLDRRPPDQRSPFEERPTGRKSYLQKIADEYGKQSMKDFEVKIPFDPADEWIERPRNATAEMAYYDVVLDSMGLHASFFDIGGPELRRPRESSDLERAEAKARENVKDYLLDPSQLDVSWQDIAGNEEAHRAMIEAIEFPIKHAELYAHYRKKMTKGIALSGPPGCGKTMFGKAAASIISKLHGKKASMLYIKGVELQAMYVGQTEQRIKNIFAYARAYHALHGHQLVIFIDEADSLLPHRDDERTYGYQQGNVSTFLAEMDGLEASSALIILATNRLGAIDPAILRDGRIDRNISVRRPTQNAAMVIASRAFKGVPLDKDPPLLPSEYMVDELFSPMRNLLVVKHEKGKDFFNLHHCVSGAMIVGLVERAKGHAFHRDLAHGTITGVGKADIDAAIEDVFKDKTENIDSYALREFAQLINAPVLEINKVTAPEIKYVGTLQ